MDIWGRAILCWGRLTVHCRMFSSIPGLCPLDASRTLRTPVVIITHVCGSCRSGHWGQNHPGLRGALYARHLGSMAVSPRVRAAWEQSLVCSCPVLSQHLEECLAQSRGSVNGCWMNEWMGEPLMTQLQSMRNLVYSPRYRWCPEDPCFIGR